MLKLSFSNKKLKNRAVKFVKNFSAVLFACLILGLILFVQLSKTNGYSKTKNSANIRIHDKNIFKQKLWKFGDDKDKYLESERLKQSLKNEMLEMVEKKDQVLSSITKMKQAIPELKATVYKLKSLIDEQKSKTKEYEKVRNVHLKLPKKPLSPKNMQNQIDVESNVFQTIKDSIDYRRCSVNKQLTFFLYPLPSGENDSVAINFYNEFQKHSSITDNPSFACIFIVFVTIDFDSTKYKYWNNFGQNHILIFVNDDVKIVSEIGAAIVVNSYFLSRQFRSNMDIAAFLRLENSDISNWKILPALLPHNRKTLLSFQAGPYGITSDEIKDLYNFYESANHSDDIVSVDINCAVASSNERMSLCGSKDDRKKHLSKSVFTLIYPNTKSFQQRFFEALEAGAIPVILSMTTPLPFEEFIDWRKAVFRIPISRLPELHFILRSISLADILEYQRKGRLFFENYLHNTEAFVKTIISFMRYRLQMPITEDKAVKAKPLFQVKDQSGNNKIYSFFPPTLTSNFNRSPLDNEFLGSFEAPFASKDFTHNFTIFGMYAYKIWNDYPYLTDYTPQFLMEEVSMPSEAEFFRQTNTNMRPITSGSGKEFSNALGGNRPNEQLTIVIVTYNRDETLKYQLQDLHEIPFLNRIIVVWNNVEREPPLSWPKLNVPVYFVKAEKNSLNNRFIPYDLIKTEAVLSLDDDLKIMRHEIVFAFRVWRQERTKIVGFPARYHYQTNGNIFYKSNHTCQYSMILTGAAFLHKNYFYAYTFGLPKIIHQKIDEYMNCEDIAMNFLVAHLTRQPPIKVGNKWSTLCPDGTLRGSNICPDSLSIKEEHYEKRHKCIKFFTKVFGYNPLLFSQYRVNSVLFWSKDLPKHHQKCFRFI